MSTTTWTRAAAAAAATALVAAVTLVGAAPASAETAAPRPERFTSAYTVTATPDTIVDGSGAPVAGQPGASGTFDILLNADRDVICWDMDVRGLQGTIEGQAKTGVTLREAPASYGGPPRIAVPEPEREGDAYVGGGCARGPFTTGVEGSDGSDTGTSFSVSDIEADPTAYAVDVRTTDHPEGAVRGQLTPVPLGGLDTGEGGLAGPSAARLGLGLAAVGAVGAAGLAGWRRTRLED